MENHFEDSDKPPRIDPDLIYKEKDEFKKNKKNKDKG